MAGMGAAWMHQPGAALEQAGMCDMLFVVRCACQEHGRGARYKLLRFTWRRMGPRGGPRRSARAASGSSLTWRQGAAEGACRHCC